MFGSSLSIQLVPPKAFGRNLRSVIDQNSWKKLSLVVRANTPVCPHCETNPTDHCHEVWEWVLVEGFIVQRLIRLEGVCKECHEFIHLGKTSLGDRTRLQVVIRRAMDLLGLDDDQMLDYINRCFAAHLAVSDIPVTQFMSLRWIHKVPAMDLGFIESEWQPIWEQIDLYETGWQNEEYTKEQAAEL